MRATVAVTAAGEPVGDDAMKLMSLQNAEAIKAKRSIKDDYMIVYLPPSPISGYRFHHSTMDLWCYLKSRLDVLSFARAIDRLDKRRQRRGGDGLRPDLYILFLKCGLLWIAKITYMLSLGIVIPVCHRSLYRPPDSVHSGSNIVA
jgi:E3 ubiquitin-protein ligase MARCH6